VIALLTVEVLVESHVMAKVVEIMVVRRVDELSRGARRMARSKMMK